MVSTPVTIDPDALLGQLTPKQVDCLKLVLLHRTSKQIARTLGISRYTVDQRLDAARRILNTNTRLDAAAKYAELKALSEPFVYDSFGMASSGLGGATKAQAFGEPVVRFEEAAAIRFQPPWETSYSERQSPTAALVKGDLTRRVGILVGLTLAMMVVVIVGLAMFASLSQVMRSH